MGIDPIEEIPDGAKLSWQDCYWCIYEFYIKFAAMWSRLSLAEKQAYKMGNGRPGRVDFVDASIPFIYMIPLEPTEEVAISLAKSVVFGVLEYAFHDHSGKFKVAAYAMHILKLLNNGQL